MKRFLSIIAILVSLFAIQHFDISPVPVANAGPFDAIFNGNGTDSIVYCQAGTDCSLSGGINIVTTNVNDIEKQKTFSQYIQDITAYALGFVALICVILIIFAGFRILFAAGKEEEVKKAKSMIIHAVIGIVLMFLAWSLFLFVLKFLDSAKTPDNPAAIHIPSVISQAYAYSDYDTNTFDEFKQKMEALTSQLDRDYKLTGKLSTASLNDLAKYVNGAIDTFPDNDDKNYNVNLGKNLLVSIDYVRQKPDSDSAITELAKNLSDFLTKTKIGRITGKITATPQSGSAPLAVTLRASDVIDPSGVVVPKANYIWSIRSAGGVNTVIGTGPSILYRFNEERNYTVSLTIISASRNTKGKIDVLPFSGEKAKIIINVLPRIGNIYMNINGVSVSNLERLKITPVIGRAGVLIDASASVAAAGSQFVKTSWDFGNGITKNYDGSPKVERQIFANEGTYTVKLTITTNEEKYVVKTLQLDVVNPIASISVDRTSGFSNEDFKFQASTYFGGGQFRYEWSILDLAAEKIIYTKSAQNITYKFPRSGKYAVKLKTNDAAGREDNDTAIITIESRDPVASLSASSVSGELPNVYFLDATSSYDPDSMDNSRLTFDWTIDGNNIELDDPARNGAMGKYTFNTLGTHNVSLRLTNQDGKVTTLNRSISVTSLLSVKLRFAPRITKVGSTIIIIADAKNAKTFEWNFGDGNNDITSVGRTTHVFKKSGQFDISLTVRGTETSSVNSISRKVYVADSDEPYALITLKMNNEEMTITPDSCNGQDAYVIDRAHIVNLSAEQSINVDGSNAGLTYTWKYVNKNSNQQQFSYKFDELGCFPIDLSIRSNKNGKISTMRSYVKVENLIPKLSGITINAVNTNTDPVIVNVSAGNAVDDDGVIVSYLWYYYTDSDPEPQDFRLTRVPRTSFVLPKISGKYFFAVTVEDSNGAKVNSDQLSEDRNSLTLAGDNVNTPLLTLKTSSTAIFVGDSVSYDMTTKNILGTDISEKSEYKWDFDGDGFYDDTTTSPRTKHIYSKPGTYNFKVKATYKGMSNTKYQQIVVQNQLKPSFEYIAIGNRIILLNTTKGIYTTANWDLGNSITSTNLDSVVYDFSEGTFPSVVSLDVSDNDKTTKNITLPVKRDIINRLRVEKKSAKLVYFTYPQTDENGEIHIISPDQKVYIYLGASKGAIKKYAIDSNVDIDTDLDGIKDNDIDNRGTESETKGLPYTIRDFDEKIKERNIRLMIYGENNTLTESKNLKIILDNVKESTTASGALSFSGGTISEEDKAILAQLKEVITTTPQSIRPKMMDYLLQLQESWGDEREKTKIIIDFESYIEQNLSGNKKQQEDLYSMLESLLVSQKNIDNKVQVAAKIVKNLTIKSKSAEVISKKMDEILSHPTDFAKNKQIGQEILKLIEKDSDITMEDKLIIKAQLQDIVYSNKPNEQGKVETPVTTESGGIGSFIIMLVKIIGWIFGGLIVVGILLFIYYKLRNTNENLEFQDFIIEKFFGGSAKKSEEIKTEVFTQKKPDLPVKEMVNAETTTSNELPAINEGKGEISEIPTPAIAPAFELSGSETLQTTTPDESAVPDWLKGGSFTSEESAVSTEKTTTNSLESEVIKNDSGETPVVQESIPDWLKGGAVFEEPVATPVKEEMPDWLKGMNEQEIMQEVNEELAPRTEAESVTADVVAPNDPFAEKIPEEAITLASEELPEWLRVLQNEEKTETNTQPENISTPDYFTIPEVETEVKQDSVASPFSSDFEEEKVSIEVIPEDSTPFEIEEVGMEKIKKSTKKSSIPKPKKPAAKAKLTPDIPTQAGQDDLPEWLK